MSSFLAAVALVPFFAFIGDDLKPKQNSTAQKGDAKPVAALVPGMPAPVLSVSKWLQGREVKAFEPGRIYVVEFWAVWCGPCIALMPHLAEMQHQYKNKGVTIIGFSAADPKNSAQQVAAFVKKRGPKLEYTFAFVDDRSMWDAWMGAAARGGIPCTFVVDKTGRIAYIGHPTFLPVVLPMAVAGVEAESISKEVNRIREEYSETISGAVDANPKAALKALKGFEARYPVLIDFMPSVRIKLSYLPRYGEQGETLEYAARLVARAIERNDPLNLKLVAGILRAGHGKEDKELLAIAVKAAQADVQMSGEHDSQALLNLAETYFAAGDKALARAWGQKAIDAAGPESSASLEAIKQQVKRFDAGK